MSHISEQELHNRVSAFGLAKELIAPIVEQHGGIETIEETRSVSTGLFTATPVKGSTSKIDQHIGHILNVAGWLLKE